MIKEDIQDINDASALHSILAIEPKKYKSCIPNIMLLSHYDDSIIALPWQPFEINELEKEYADNQVFIQGTEIDDFHILD